MTPNDTRPEPTLPDRRQLSTLSAVAFSDRRQIVFGQSIPQAAIFGGIDQSTPHGRHQHPDPGSLEH